MSVYTPFICNQKYFQFQQI